jgi:GNAT superfamily N-acetyltransferase
MAPEPRNVGPDPDVAAILTDAFAADPFMAWIFGGIDDRQGVLRVWWDWLVTHGPDGGEVWRTDDSGAAAIWYPPRHARPEAEPTLEPEAEPVDDGEEAVDPFVELLTGLIGERVSEVLAFFGQGSAMHPPEPHWYLLALGTLADRQGQGLGARLVRPVLDRCDTEGLGVYLESSNPRNIPFYHRLGFVEVGELWTPDDTALVTGMWRAPR